MKKKYSFIFRREISSYMAPVFTKAGVVVVAIGYNLAPDGKA